ncbi:MAG: hypothetical protein DME24_17400 [Verrucomicrobia bacterium]|nr:MAG: hypothetical protein DME24_17400 [Verrucomicrobiota bacterium]
MADLPPDREPTISSDKPTSCYLLILNDAEDVSRFHRRCIAKKIQLRPLGERTFLLFSFDPPDDTLQWLKQSGEPKHEIGLVVLGSYHVIT